jgi:hypothetical protein
MKKIIFIFIATAFIAGVQATANSNNGKNIETMEILNECWTEEGNSENKIVWYENGTFSFTETNPEKTYSAFGSGTYIYQTVLTRDIFAQVTDLNEKQVTNDTTKHNFPLKKYFLISQITDSMVVVLSIPSEYEIDWYPDEKGKLHVTIINTDIVWGEFPPFEEKPKYYKRSKLEIDELKNE